VGGRDDDLLHHVPLHLVRHGVQRHQILAGGARNPDPRACDVDDAVENAVTVAALLAAEKAEKAKALASFQRDLRRRVAARAAAERDDRETTVNIALAVATNDPRGRDRCTARAAVGVASREPSPLEALLASAAAKVRESHRSLLAACVPPAFGGDRATDETNHRETRTDDVAESRGQRAKNARDAASAAERRERTRRISTTAARDDARTRSTGRESTAPTTEDVARWLAHRGLTFEAVPPICSCPHARTSAPFDEDAAFRCARNCPLYNDPAARDEATREVLRALGP
jgi:hypothetical protein